MGKMSDALDRGGKGLPGTPEGSASQTDGAQQATDPGRSAQAGQRAGQGRYPENMDISTAGIPRLRGAADEDQEKLVSLYAPGSPQAKRIDILRSQLLFPFHGEPPRTIMIVSSVAGEGRSLLTANLAVSFARGLQQFVMVLDCHLMDPVQHHLLGVPRQPGLTDYLEHGATVPEIIHRTSVDKLSVIPAGTPSHRSAEILATDRMADMLAELRARYADRYMILDTPPVQAFDDPAVLARLVEAIVFVVMAGETDREQVLRGLRALPEEKIVGVVMNDRNSTVVDASSLAAALEEEN